VEWLCNNDLYHMTKYVRFIEEISSLSVSLVAIYQYHPCMIDLSPLLFKSRFICFCCLSSQPLGLTYSYCLLTYYLTLLKTSEVLFCLACVCCDVFTFVTLQRNVHSYLYETSGIDLRWCWDHAVKFGRFAVPLIICYIITTHDVRAR